MALDFLAVTLRFLHIAGAVAWAGSAIFIVAVLDPMAKRIPRDEADRLMRHLQLRSSLGKFFPTVAGITTLAGILLYLYLMLKDPPQTGPDALSPVQNMVLNIGIVAGVAAFVYGMVAEGRTNKKVQVLSATIEANKPVPEAGEFARLSAKLATATRVSTVLLAIAIFGMGTFRYWDLA